MIHFACFQCGMKLKVKDEFAGRASKCPTCKRPVKVPEVSRTQGAVLPGKLDGSASSLEQAGVAADVTLPPSRGAPAPERGQRSMTTLLSDRSCEGGRYVLDAEIARGGMGAVMRGIDRDLRREVAIKFMLSDKDSKQKARFIEEAQITGQLEHPNIVPIHELGVDAQKRLFFTMTMVKGRSLAQILETLGEPGALATGGEWPLSRLLNIVVNICHALGYAHSRNVIHRDLKPANIMVGDFGEVYVMDWSLAKVLGHQSEVRDQKSGVGVQKAGTFSRDPKGSAAVTTNRSMEADLTQAGLDPLSGMPLTHLDLRSAELEDLSPLAMLRLEELSLSSCKNLRDLEPLRGMPLRSLNLYQCSKVQSLAPLMGIPLQSLALGEWSQLRDADLELLRGMPLTSLDLHGCYKLSQLDALKGMPLEILNIERLAGIKDLSPLQGMPLKKLVFTPKNISQGIEVIRQMKTLEKVQTLYNVPEWSAAEFWKRYDAGEFNK